MDLNVWCIFASILIVTAGATRFDLGPQKFYESSSPAPRRDQNAAAKDVVLYLTPSQIKALEAGGAVVRPAEPENVSEEASEEGAQENEDQPEENAEQEQEQEEEQETNENEAEQPEQQEEAEQPEQVLESEEELQSQDLALEEILRILNEEELEQEQVAAEQALNEPQVTEESSEEDNPEEERQIPLRFQARQNQQQQQPQQQEKYLAPIAQTARSKVYAAIRYQRNEKPQRTIVQFPRQQQQEARQNQEQQEQPQTATPGLKRYRLVPYQVVEQAEPAKEQEQQEQQAQQDQEQQQEGQQPTDEQRTEQQENEDRLSALLTPLLSPEKLADVINQRKNKLTQNELELQAILKELKQSSKHNDQKYAIEIERLRANLQKQNALSKAEAIAKTAPQLIRKEILKRRPSQSAKQDKAQASVARNAEPKAQKQRASRPQPVPVEVTRPVPVPVVKTQKAEVPKPVPVEVEKRVPVPVTRNVYVKVNKPYLVERIVPVDIKKEIPVESPIRKSQRLTILRHIWDH